MKRLHLLFTFMWFVLFGHAQELPANHAEWVKFYSSYGIPSSAPYSKDKMEYTEVDGQGYVYYCSHFAKLCRQGINGQDGKLVPDMPDLMDSNANYCLWLAKYDTLGNEIWHHTVCSSGGVYPSWMELRDNTLYLTGLCSCYTQSGWIWLFDTMIWVRDFWGTPAEERLPPMDYMFNFVARFDLSGNLQNIYFLNIAGRNSSVSQNVRNICLFNESSPMHVDIDGNMYIFSFLNWDGLESSPLTITVCNGDSVWRHNLFLPYNLPVANHQCIRPALFKFDADGHLLWYRLIGMETEGIPLASRYYQVIYNEPDPDAVFPFYRFHYNGFDSDKEDNLYFTGTFTLLPPCELNHDQYQALGYQFPCKIYFDSTHWVQINHRREALSATFLAKFDTSGNVQWIQQPHVRNSRIDADSYIDASPYYGGITVTDNSIFVLGGAFDVHDEDTIFFDSTHYFERGGDNAQHEMYPLFLRFDRATGNFLNYGTNYMRGTLNNGSLSSGMYCDYDFKRHFALEDRVYATMRHLYYHSITSGYTLWKAYLTVWQPDTRIADTIARIRCMDVEYANLYPLQNGRVLFDYSICDDITIDSITFNTVNRGAVAFGMLRGKTGQQIDWGQDLRYTLADSPVSLTATATSGLPVSYESSNDAVARVNGSTLHLLRVGEAQITARQQGNTDYLPATPVTQTLTVYDENEGIVLADEPDMVVVFPNPFCERVTIKVESSKLKVESGVVTAWLTDMQGRREEVRLVPQGHSSNNTLTQSSNQTYTLDLTNRPQAAYLLTLTTATGRQITLRLLKQSDIFGN